MFHTTSAPRRSTAAIAIFLVVGALSLTGCQTVALREQTEQSTSRGAQSAPMPREFAGVPADRIAEALDRQAADDHELAERFAGVPADRIEEQLAREQGE